MQMLVALLAGALFGAGLTVSRMIDPRKVLDFLDIAGLRYGTWDPTLLMVFAGALTTMFVSYAIQRRMARPVLAPGFSIPARTDIDIRLVGGSAVFGIGWGMVGICPGPALTALAVAGSQIGNVALFVGAMAAGIMLSRLLPAGEATVDAPATEARS